MPAVTYEIAILHFSCHMSTFTFTFESETNYVSLVNACLFTLQVKTCVLPVKCQLSLSLLKVRVTLWKVKVTFQM